MYLTVRGIVLRITEYNDRDALVTLLTQQHGKLTVKARGLRGRNSPLTAPCQLLTYSEYTLHEYRGRYTIHEAHTLELFHGLRKNLSKLALSTYFAQAVELISQEDLPNPELLSLILNCLYGLSKLDVNIEQVKAVFELRAACLAGYTPDLFGCHVCGNQNPVLFDLSGGQLECRECRDPSSNGIRMPVDPALLAAMRYISLCDPKRLFAFGGSEEFLSRLAALTEAYLATQLERGFSALDFYKSLVF